MSNCKVIALTNQKGGVGKTTTAVNLGVSLVQQGKKVLLIDADAQANLTMALGYNRPDDIPITLSTVMQNIIDDKTLDVSQGIIHHSEGVDLLPSNIEMSGFEVRLINAMSRERVLKTYVNEVKKNYDYVLIDCMPSLGMITINALAAADSVIIPTQPHYLSAKGLELLLRSVSMVKRQINPKLRIDGILMTMVMPRTNISKERYDYILIDCMPSLGMITINAFACADSILIPVQAAYLPVKGLEQLIKTIGKVKRQINPKLSIEGILLTMVDCRTNYAKDISALLIVNYGSKVKIFENSIPISVRAAEISAEGVSIYQHDPKGKVASAYQSLTEEVLGNE